jgi:hypothetical protein
MQCFQILFPLTGTQHDYKTKLGGRCVDGGQKVSIRAVRKPLLAKDDSGLMFEQNFASLGEIRGTIRVERQAIKNLEERFTILGPARDNEDW